ncbi:MAG: hypothetical protein ACRDKI_08800 [Solirubrobacterales bacterium]
MRAKVCLLGAAIVLLAFVTPSAEAAARPDHTLGDVPDTILDGWRDDQMPDGNFQRPSGTPVWGGYGNGALAYAMLLEAVRTGDDSYFRAAMNAYGWMAHKQIHPQGVFFRMFVAAGYNLANSQYGDRDEFQAIRAAWATRLRRMRYDDGRFGVKYRYNKNLVEAVEVLELLRSGVRSKTPGAILRDRADALRRTLRVMQHQVPGRSNAYSVWAAAPEGWPHSVKLSDFSDPPDNPPAYDALVASMYARAYSLLPAERRSATMRNTARALMRGVVARTAPDGDIAFAGRSQEEAWSLTSAMHAAWFISHLTAGADRDLFVAYARRVRSRLLTAHVSSSGDQFYLTPAQSCCGKSDRPPGQDAYFDLASYTGLSAIGLGWALLERPNDWAEAGSKIPTDNFSIYHFPFGRGRFLQHRGDGIYWMLREQGDFADARADMAVAVFKARRADGSWADVVPPRPYSGGHHHAADPASPCLAFGKNHSLCAYLELHAGHPVGDGYRYAAVWRTRRRTQIFAGSATVTPTPKGLILSWSGHAGQVFKVDQFLPDGRCTKDGVAGPGLTVTVSGQSGCRVVAKNYAGGSRIDLDRLSSVTEPLGGSVSVAYTTTLGP